MRRGKAIRARARLCSLRDLWCHAGFAKLNGEAPLATELTAYREYWNWLLAASYFLVSLGLVELAYDSRASGRGLRGESLRDYLLGIPHETINLLFGYTFMAAILLYLGEWQPFRWPVNLLSWLIAVVVADFISYWYHRLEHGSRLFWAHHRVHHSSEEFSLNTSFRLAWHEFLIFWVYVLPMIALGFAPLQAMLSFKIVVIYHIWIHNQKVPRLPWLEKVFVGPSFHRVHHGTNPQYLDRNFGVMLSIWDRLFGTFTPEEEPVRYGLHPVRAGSLWELNFGEYFRIARDVKRARGVRARLRHVFGRP